MAVPVIGLRGSFSAGFSARRYHFQRPLKPVTSGFAVIPIFHRLFGETQFQNGENKPRFRIERRDSDQTPGGFQPRIQMPNDIRIKQHSNHRDPATTLPGTFHIRSSSLARSLLMTAVALKPRTVSQLLIVSSGQLPPTPRRDFAVGHCASNANDH